MKEYNLPESLLSAVRSLPNYQEWRLCCRDYDNISDIRKYCKMYSSISEGRLQFERILVKYGIRDFCQAVCAVHNAYMRTTRIRKRVDFILSNFGRCAFLTLTISNDFINDDFHYHVNRVKRVLKSSSTIWVFNDDYGDKNHRLHFHAVCSLDLIEDIQSLWQYGFASIQWLRQTDLDERRVSRYMTKLARHATKTGAGRNWYSRLKLCSCPEGRASDSERSNE